MAKKKKTTTKKKSPPPRSRSRPPMTRKKSPKRDRSVVSKKRDRETLGKIESLAVDVTKSSLAQRDPYLDIPLRTTSNTKWNKTTRLLEMGSNKHRPTLSDYTSLRASRQINPCGRFASPRAGRHTLKRRRPSACAACTT